MNNKKNKGKSKVNKPPNQPQKIEKPSKDPENIEDVTVTELDSAQKSDVRVPEIMSEVVTPVVEVKETEEDSPKKPKRNRGKKKKNEKDEDEIQDDKPRESVEIIEIVEVETQEVLIEENVAPSARKKKNKNKKVTDLETKEIEKEEKLIQVNDPKKTQEAESRIEETMKPQEVPDQEAKPSKKKNKKKKRSDSERSDKADELSCTSAFQQLLIDDKSEVKTEEKQQSEEMKMQVKSLPDKMVDKDLIKETTSAKSTQENLDKLEESNQDLPQTSTNESGNKNKKKNKKDKKEAPKEKEIIDSSDSSKLVPEFIPIASVSPTPKELIENVKEQVIKETKTPEDLVSKDQVEEIKPKAKVAKPVDKKRKGKEDSQIQETPRISTAEEHLPLPKEQLIEAISVGASTLDFSKQEDNIQEIVSPESQAITMKHSTETKPTEIADPLKMDENNKRKKSPKPGKQDQKTKTPSLVEIKPDFTKEKEMQTAIKTEELKESHPIKERKSHDDIITEAFEELIRIPESDKSKKRKRSPKPNKTDQQAGTLLETVDKTVNAPTITSVKEIKPVVEETVKSVLATDMTELSKEQAHEEPKPLREVEKELLLEKEDIKADETKIPDTKSKKKGKKSSKLPLESEIEIEAKKPIAASKLPSKTKEKDSDTPKTENVSQGKTDVFYDMPLADVVEIESLKTDESEGSTSGYTPDIIQYPRATSQDLIDSNNNISIQEITVEEVKLQIPTVIPDTPFIQGSGETPLSTPECVFIGVQISEMKMDAGKVEQEKTDIKSKMMEVNQDMEELRRSIERSLAELTAIERNEGEIEKAFVEKASHVPDAPKSPEVKISMPSELFKSQTEKMENPILKEKPIEENIAFTKVDVVSIAQPSEIYSENKNVKAKQHDKNILQPTSSTADTPKSTEKPTEAMTPPIVPARKDKSVSKEREIKNIQTKAFEEKVKPTEIVSEILIFPETVADTSAPPTVPARKDNKNKGKNKKKGKQDAAQTVTQSESTSTCTESKEPMQETTKKEETTEQKTNTKQDKGKQHSTLQTDDTIVPSKQEDDQSSSTNYNPIENFEDAMTSSADDINKTFEIIANEANQNQFIEASHVNPEIKIVAPVEEKETDKKDEKVSPVSPSKNLLGHPDIPVPSNRTDYKKERNKAPNTILAKVKIKDAVHIEGKKETKDTQTDNIQKFLKTKSIDESFSSVSNENDEFIYKYSFRKVYLQSACHVCKKELKQTRVPCNFCNLIFYCNAKHKDEDWAKHQGFCFAVSTIVHLKNQKHIYADLKNITGQDYRLLRMQMIVSCEKVLKRKLTPFGQEALLYPRVCANAACREWRQNKLVDCDGCGQISYCAEYPDHFPRAHQRWCKSYFLYQKLVCYQQSHGRLEPKLPSKIMVEPRQVPEKMNEVLAAMYEEKIDMNDIQYAALTQIATAPLTAAYCLQAYAKLANLTNGTSKKTSCTIHIVGGELQFEADALNKWEVFFLHLRPDLQELRVVMIGRDLNPSSLPLELLGKVKLCESCREDKRRVVFSFQDKTTYFDYWASDAFIVPDIVCAFNPSIKRSSIYNGNDPWPKTINCILKLKTPFVVTGYTMNELQRDLARVKECSEVDHRMIIEPKYNSFASVRPDRNFISDDEMPLLFKNYCYTLIAGAN